MKSKIFLSMLVIMVAISMVVGGTFAWFFDSTNSPDNTFTTGSIKVDLTDVNGLDGSAIFLEFANNTLVQPGDASFEKTIIIKNTGTLDAGIFRRIVVSDNDMANALILTKFSVIDWSYNGSLLGVDAWDTNGDDKISLLDLVNNRADNMDDGWNMIGLKPGHTMAITMQFVLDGALATPAMMEMPFIARMEVIATQNNAEAITAAFNGSAPYPDLSVITTRFNSDFLHQ